jgi:hypothetical protein
LGTVDLKKLLGGNIRRGFLAIGKTDFKKKYESYFFLVGGFNPSEKYESVGIIPNILRIKNTPTSFDCFVVMLC